MTSASPDEVVTLPSPTTEEVLSCQFSSWYDTFRNLEQKRSNVTIKSTVIRPLPCDFLEYLQSDGVRLPLGATKVSSCAPSEREGDDTWSSDSEDGNNDDEGATPRQFFFPELNQQIQEGIEKLGGSVIPKLNWSSPKDATWINNGTLKCETPGDVYLLLKSSDFVMHDLTHAVEDPSNVDYELVLRKWCNLHPSMEFRCFVYNNELGTFPGDFCHQLSSASKTHPVLSSHETLFSQSSVAISQRQHTQHFPHLPRDRVVICSQITDFFDTVIEENFRLANYVFDVYIDKKERVWLLDFNVWGTQTDTLLYTWDELMGMVGDEESNYPEMRVVETEREVHHDPLASYRAPIDTVELATVTGNDRNKFEEFMAMCDRPPSVSEE